MASIQKLYVDARGDSIVFVILSLDKDRDKEKVVKYIKDKEFTFPVYLPSGYLSEQLNVPSIPTTFVIGKDGKIAAKEVGATNFNTPKFKKFLQKLVGEK
jgi:peroxiredoxin